VKRLLRILLSRTGAEFVETAIALPIILLITLGMVYGGLAAFASVNANNAANYGARIGSVNQRGQAAAAYNAAMQSVGNAKVGNYSVVVTGGGFPGAQISVQVDWNVPSLLDPLVALVGGGSIGDGGLIKGSAKSVFRQEGW
jgi:Flp pilus assembly protein TadG